ncbi:MAG: M60 family metallopeptidase [Phycisphaerales bacterium]
MLHRLAAALTALVFATPVLAATPDVAPLLEGVTEIAAPGSPGSLAVMNDHAAAVIAGKADKDLLAPVVLAAQWEKGRIVAFGHSGYLDADTAAKLDTTRLLINAIRWCAGGKADPRILIAAGNLGELLGKSGFTQVSKLSGDLPAALKTADVVLIGERDLSDADRAALTTFIMSGGGIIAAQTGWGWQQIHNGADMRTNNLNRLLLPAGVNWTDDFAGKSGKSGFAVGPAPAIPSLPAALELLTNSAGKDATRDPALRQAAASATHGVRLLPRDDQTIRPRLAKLLKEHEAALIPADKKPLGAKQPLERFLLAFQFDELRDLPPAQVTVHPAAAGFPGSPTEDARPVTRTVSIDLSVPGWHSLGLYAPAGKVVTVQAAGETKIAKNLSVRIGCHTDHLWHLPSWKRVPEISRAWKMSGEKLDVASSFGGIVYIDVPEKLKGEARFTISGAVESPLFVLGKTSVDEWQSTIRAAPGPWAELQAGKVIVAVPSTAIRNLDDPTEVLQFWDKIVSAQDELACTAGERARPERYVADIQISAGYMHSGYPIMTHLDAADDMVQAARLKAGRWGLFHELGHNHQNSDWTFDGTGEVTVNIFSLYTCETVCGLPMSTGHDAVDKRADRDARAKKHTDTGADFNKWKSDPFLALEMYIQLREAFGWETFHKVFAEYKALPKDQRPKGDEQERDQWMVRFSRASGHNLGPFFAKWGVPTSQAARDSIKDLPGWMPPGW